MVGAWRRLWNCGEKSWRCYGLKVSLVCVAGEFMVLAVNPHRACGLKRGGRSGHDAFVCTKGNTLWPSQFAHA